MRLCATGSSTWRFIVDCSCCRAGRAPIRFCPPLCVNRRQVEIGLELFSATLEATLGGRKQGELERRRKHLRIRGICPRTRVMAIERASYWIGPSHRNNG